MNAGNIADRLLTWRKRNVSDRPALTLMSVQNLIEQNFRSGDLLEVISTSPGIVFQVVDSNNDFIGVVSRANLFSKFRSMIKNFMEE